ncbi:hypothetical protein [Vibrio crassostreae]|jgi:hypothetical protein|uniref:hypothetical protein n=1 Tax=Vibrio crassostreae TaxID=246167 RepID=UPI001B309F74|nr:hypothetical protein [Vibrio crassostreae]
MSWWHWAQTQQEKEWLIQHLVKHYSHLIQAPIVQSLGLDNTAHLFDNVINEEDKKKIRRLYSKYKYDHGLKAKGLKIARFKLKLSTLNELEKLAKAHYNEDQTRTISELIGGSFDRHLDYKHDEKMARIEAKKVSRGSILNARRNHIIEKLSEKQLQDELKSRDFECAELQRNLERIQKENESLQCSLAQSEEYISRLEHEVNRQKKRYTFRNQNE